MVKLDSASFLTLPLRGSASLPAELIELADGLKSLQQDVMES